MAGVADQIFQGSHLSGAGEMVGKVQSYKSPFITEETDQVVRQIPPVGCHRPGIGMGRHRRHFAGHQDFPGPFIIEVAGVYDHMHTFHGFDDFPSLLRNPPVFSFHAIGKSDFIGIVPGERHEADAILIQLFQLLHAACRHFAPFHGKKSPYFPLFLRFPYILPAPDRAETGMICFQFPPKNGQQVLIPLPEIRRFLPVHPEGEILDEAASLFQLLQVYIERIFHESPLLRMVMELGDGVAVEINIFHGALPHKTKSAGHEDPRHADNMKFFLYHTIGQREAQGAAEGFLQDFAP